MNRYVFFSLAVIWIGEGGGRWSTSQLHTPVRKMHDTSERQSFTRTRDFLLEGSFSFYHHAEKKKKKKNPYTSIILSWFSIPLLLKYAAEILKICLQIKHLCPKMFLNRDFA